MTDADADGASLDMDAQGDDGALEARVGHARHCQQQLAGKERRLNHALAMARHTRRGKG